MRTADVQLRGLAGPLWTRVAWPGPGGSGPSPALLVCFPAAGPVAGDADPLSRELCARGGVVVLALSSPVTPETPVQAALQDATTVLEWAADHAAELDADPGRLLVAGDGPGGGIAAATALHARDQHWPALARQLLVFPDFPAGPASPLRAPTLAGVAAATVVTADDDPAATDGRRYAARLREDGVQVKEVRHRHLRNIAGAMTLAPGGCGGTVAGSG
jgi:acetyl esterase